MTVRDFVSNLPPTGEGAAEAEVRRLRAEIIEECVKVVETVLEEDNGANAFALAIVGLRIRALADANTQGGNADGGLR